jgi:hypothetical protein
MNYFIQYQNLLSKHYYQKAPTYEGRGSHEKNGKLVLIEFIYEIH